MSRVQPAVPPPPCCERPRVRCDVSPPKLSRPQKRRRRMLTLAAARALQEPLAPSAADANLLALARLEAKVDSLLGQAGPLPPLPTDSAFCWNLAASTFVPSSEPFEWCDELITASPADAIKNEKLMDTHVSDEVREHRFSGPIHDVPQGDCGDIPHYEFQDKRISDELSEHSSWVSGIDELAGSQVYDQLEEHFCGKSEPSTGACALSEHPRWGDFLLYCGRLHFNVRYAKSESNFKILLGESDDAFDAIPLGSWAPPDEPDQEVPEHMRRSPCSRATSGACCYRSCSASSSRPTRSPPLARGRPGQDREEAWQTWQVICPGLCLF
mmetsp:Transcript_138026/g.428976  ORF Transcript_138026/g.428976 Transcript_138026/m.428976 type:complete len:327 (+) Transcript_138026:52-1032(+)